MNSQDNEVRAQFEARLQGLLKSGSYEASYFVRWDDGKYVEPALEGHFYYYQAGFADAEKRLAPHATGSGNVFKSCTALRDDPEFSPPPGVLMQFVADAGVGTRCRSIWPPTMQRSFDFNEEQLKHFAAKVVDWARKGSA